MTSACFQPSDDRWLCCHPFGYFGLSQSRLFPGVEDCIEQGEFLFQRIVLTQECRS